MGFCGMTQLPGLEGDPCGNLPHELTLVLVRQRRVQGGSDLLSDRQLSVSR